LKYPIVLAQTKAALDFVVTEASQARGLGWQDADGWKKTIKTLQDSGLISGSDIPVDSLFTNRFIVNRPNIPRL